MLVVTGEARRTGLQLCQPKALRTFPVGLVGGAEEVQELSRLHRLQPLLLVGHDLVAARGKDVCWQPIVTHCQQTMSWLQMDIVATAQGLLPFGIDVGAKVVLVGRLVRREACVTIEAVGGILDRNVADFRIERDNAPNSLCNAIFKLGLGCQIFFFMLLEPGTIVVANHVVQEADNHF